MEDEKLRINISSGVHWEPLRGYSRAVCVGDSLWISGTTAMTKGGEIVGIGNAYEQTRFILSRIKQITEHLNFQLSDIVRTRISVTNIALWDEYARAHREMFDTIRPASSIVQVARLVDLRLMVEIEAEAVRGLRLVDTQIIA